MEKCWLKLKGSRLYPYVWCTESIRLYPYQEGEQENLLNNPRKEDFVRMRG